MPAVWNRHERCGAHRANFARTGTVAYECPSCVYVPSVLLEPTMSKGKSRPLRSA